VRELGRTCGECIEPRLPGRRREREVRHDLAILAGRRDVRGDQRVLSIVVDPEVRLRLLERHRLLDRLILRDADGLHASTFPFFASSSPFFAFGVASPVAASRTKWPACSATSAQRGGTSAGRSPNARTVWPSGDHLKARANTTFTVSDIAVSPGCGAGAASPPPMSPHHAATFTSLIASLLITPPPTRFVV